MPAEEFCKTLACFVYKNIEIVVFMTFTFLCTSILRFCPLYQAYRDIEGKKRQKHVNYVIWICQHILDNVSYLKAAI